MKTSVLFGNGINRAIGDGPSWEKLLQELMGDRKFDITGFPNTMTYERIFFERLKKGDELSIKNEIAMAMENINGGDLYEFMISLGCENYLTTNYDYAFGKRIGVKPELKATEDIYSLRRYKLSRKSQSIV